MMSSQGCQAGAGASHSQGFASAPAARTRSAVFAGQHHHAEGRNERILEPGVVVHDDGHAPNVWQEAAQQGARQGLRG